MRQIYKTMIRIRWEMGVILNNRSQAGLIYLLALSVQDPSSESEEINREK